MTQLETYIGKKCKVTKSMWPYSTDDIILISRVKKEAGGIVLYTKTAGYYRSGPYDKNGKSLEDLDPTRIKEPEMGIYIENVELLNKSVEDFINSMTL